MPTLECRHCGAPLPEAAASGPFTCPYCKTLNEPTSAIQKPKSLSPDQQKEAFKEAIKEEIEERILHGMAPRVQVPSRPVPPAAKSFMDSIRGCLTGCGCLVVLLLGGLVYGLIKDPGAVMRGFKQYAGSGLQPKDLKGITDHDWVRLQLPPPPQGWAAFDPGRDLPWLMEQVRGWAPDARLRKLRVIRLRPDGVVNLASDPVAELDVEWDAPSALAKSLTLNARSYRDLNTGLELRCTKGKWEARLELGGTRQPIRPDLTAPASAKALFAALKTAHRLPPSPLFNGALLYDSTRGWIWTFQSLTGQEAIPRMRATDAVIIR